MTLQFDGWPWKTIGHLFYATSSFVHHFVAIGEFKRFSFTSVTLTFDLRPWPFAWTSCLSMVITPENFMMIWWWEHSENGVTDRQTDDGRTDWTVLRAAWSQLKTLTTVKQAGTEYILCKTHRGHVSFLMPCNVSMSLLYFEMCDCATTQKNPWVIPENARKQRLVEHHRPGPLVAGTQVLWFVPGICGVGAMMKYTATFNTNHISLIHIIKIKQSKSNDL